MVYHIVMKPLRTYFKYVYEKIEINFCRHNFRFFVTFCCQNNNNNNNSREVEEE